MRDEETELERSLRTKVYILDDRVSYSVEGARCDLKACRTMKYRQAFFNIYL